MLDVERVRNWNPLSGSVLLTCSDLTLTLTFMPRSLDNWSEEQPTRSRSDAGRSK